MKKEIKPAKPPLTKPPSDRISAPDNSTRCVNQMPNRIIDVIDALDAEIASGKHFFVTVTDDGQGMGTFAQNNWDHLRAFCRARRQLAFVIRRFEADRCPLEQKLPMKTVCGIFATPERLDLFSAKAMETAMSTDSETGERLPIPPDIKFADAREVFPILAQVVAVSRLN